MRNFAIDVFAIFSHQPRIIDVAVENRKWKAFSKKALGKQNKRGLAKIIGAGLERKAEERNPTASISRNKFECALYVAVITREQSFEQRQIDIVLPPKR